MPIINIPGVPPLLSAVPGFDRVTSLLRGDLIPALAMGMAPQQWGVFLNGKPAIIFDTFVSIDYKQGWAISDFPLEPGAFESYDKVELPFDARVRFATGGSEIDRIAMLQSIKKAAPSLGLATIVTPEMVYPSVNIQHYNYRRTAINGVGLLQVEIWFLEIRVKGNQPGSGNKPAYSTPQTNEQFQAAFSGGATPIQYPTLPGAMSAYNAGFAQAAIPSPFQTGGLNLK